MSTSSYAIEIFRRNSSHLSPIVPEIDCKLKRVNDIHVVLFDIYGTLFISGSGDLSVSREVDNTHHLSEAVTHAKIKLKHPAKITLDRFYQYIQQSNDLSRDQGIAFPEVDIIDIWVRALADPELALNQIEQLAIEFESRANPVWPLPDLVSTLERIKENCRLGLVSNAQFYTPFLFEAFLARSRNDLGFDASLEFFSFREKLAKPGTELFELVVSRIRELGFGPKNVLYVGNDMLHDIYPAHWAGFRTALFAGDQRSLRMRKDDQRVDGLEPDIIVKCLSQIPDCI